MENSPFDGFVLINNNDDDDGNGLRRRHASVSWPALPVAAHSLSVNRVLVGPLYRLLTKGEAWVDRGATQFERRRTEQELASLNFSAQAKGFKLIPITQAS
jgi:hypothetical protein